MLIIEDNSIRKESQLHTIMVDAANAGNGVTLLGIAGVDLILTIIDDNYTKLSHFNS